MKVKICGLTRQEEAEYLNENGADFAGIVLFAQKSRRCVTPGHASAILKALNPNIKKVAVVVAPSLEQIQTIEALGFDYIQIHGTLDEALLAHIRLPILKAFNVNDMDQYPFFRRRRQIAGYVFDAQEPGSGKVFDWKLAADIPRDEKLLILAGGLHPGNVADAIASVRPDAVDVSSGVEREDKTGKDPDKIREFIQNAKGFSKTEAPL